MIDFKNKKILIIAPHPDDEILGCGGLISRAKKEGAKIYVIFLTIGTTNDYSKKGMSTEQERRREIHSVAKEMSYDEFDIVLAGNEYHLKLDVAPQREIINKIERESPISIDNIKPDILCIPSVSDYNQDHRAASLAAITATRPHDPKIKQYQPVILMYELPYYPWSALGVAENPNLFIRLKKEDMDQKIHGFKLYKSQNKTEYGPLSVEGIKTLSHMRGIQAGSEFAEGYIVKRITT